MLCHLDQFCQIFRHHAFPIDIVCNIIRILQVNDYFRTIYSHMPHAIDEECVADLIVALRVIILELFIPDYWLQN